ncbi:unnamed protein product [Sympodiomycopsis kandeliae]
MAGQYKYDEEGGQFFTFVLTFLLMVLVPVTWSTLTGSRKSTQSQGWFDARGQKVSTIKKINKRSLTNPRISKKLLFVVVGWAAVAYLSQRVANAASNSQHAIYDPFQILGLAAGAGEKEIKKHYKKLSIKFHPDKIRLAANETKETVEAHYIELTKAYKALTDDTIRKNFELYGHPDGRQEMSMGIALPTWVVESQNNIWVLGTYGVVFGILLPYFVARWWYGSRGKTKDGLDVATAQTFFQHLRDDTPRPRLMALLAIAEEFVDAKLDNRGNSQKDEVALKEMEDEVRNKLKAYDETWHLIPEFRSESIRKALVLLYAHQFRIESKNSKLNQERYLYAGKAEKLLNGMLQVSLAHNWLDLTNEIMHCIQCFVQAVPICEEASVAELLQLGGMRLTNAKEIVAKTELGRKGIQGFYKLDDKQRRNLVGVKEVGEKQYDHMTKVAGDWPRIELLDAFFKVSGEKLVTTGAIVQFVIKVRSLPPKKDDRLLSHGLRSDGEGDLTSTDVRSGENDDEDDIPKGGSGDGCCGGGHSGPPQQSSSSSSKEGKQPIGVARAPHFPTERKPQWWVTIGDYKQNRVIVQPTKVTDIGPDNIRTYSVQFQAPPSSGLYTFLAQVTSDSYLGSHASKAVKLQVEDASVLDGRNGAGADEDDISEPDEDTLAGQMALMRGEKVKSSPYHDDEGDEDEDDEEEEESDDGEEDVSDSDTDADE